MNTLSFALRKVQKYFPQVKTVRDSTRSIGVRVTKADTRKSRKGDVAGCALAMACKRELMIDGAIIGLKSSYLITGKVAVRYHTPESVRREITSFDRHGDFDIGEYHLGPVPKTSRLGYHRNHENDNRTDRRGKGINKVKIHRTARVRHI